MCKASSCVDRSRDRIVSFSTLTANICLRHRDRRTYRSLWESCNNDVAQLDQQFVVFHFSRVRLDHEWLRELFHWTIVTFTYFDISSPRRAILSLNDDARPATLPNHGTIFTAL